MQFHTDFQYDPAQDRRAGRTGQQRLEFLDSRVRNEIESRPARGVTRARDMISLILILNLILILKL